MLEKIAPHYSHRRKMLKKIVRRSSNDPYAQWRFEQKDKIQLFVSYKLKHKPLISIVVPAVNTPKKYLLPLTRSITAQTYSNWELVIVDVSSDSKASH
jgi:hypothetical protein